MEGCDVFVESGHVCPEAVVPDDAECGLGRVQWAGAVGRCSGQVQWAGAVGRCSGGGACLDTVSNCLQACLP
jgi:hypothetical protein